jgi:prolyl-tRNA editing enzyme YbaK/EbsC (Cys-tRNA(Pro) deacylase)
MESNKVLDHLKKFNLEDKIIYLDDSSATVKEAASALNIEEGEIAKSLSFLLNDKPILIVMSGDKKIDNSKYKHLFKEKAHMVKADDVLNIIGHPVGGVCPFGVNENVTIYLDNSLKKYDTVYPAAGSTHSAVKLTIRELEEACLNPEWIDVVKDENE